MTLRDKVIKAMTRAADAALSLPSKEYDAAMNVAALDGLISWLRENADQFKGPNLDPTTQIWVLCELLGEKESR